MRRRLGGGYGSHVLWQEPGRTCCGSLKYFLSQCCPGFLQDSLSLAGPLSLDSVNQCSLLDATYGLSFSKGLSALGLEPHLLLLLLHKHWGSWHVQRVFAPPLTPPLL